MNTNKNSATEKNPQPSERHAEAIWATTGELARRYGVSVRCIQLWVKGSLLPSVKINRIIRFNVPRCDAAVAKFERRSVS